MSEGQYLSGRLLLAMPGMFDERFARTVNVLCVHDENGALGLDIGHIREGIRFRQILKELGIDPGVAPDCAVHNGGPVEPGRGFVLHSTDWGGADTVQVQPMCALSSSLDVLRAIAGGKGPSQWLIALGYAGWSAGQLEGEMRHHGWYAAEGRSEILFDTSVDARWMATWRAEGIDPVLLSPEIGQA
jgi:putative transcriptional regulator